MRGKGGVWGASWGAAAWGGGEHGMWVIQAAVLVLVDTSRHRISHVLLLQMSKPGTCPYRPAEKHVHNDAFSNYGAGEVVEGQGGGGGRRKECTALLVLRDNNTLTTHYYITTHHCTGLALSLDGRLLIVGAPTAWDNNMDCQSGALYLIDVDEVTGYEGVVWEGGVTCVCVCVWEGQVYVWSLTATRSGHELTQKINKWRAQHKVCRRRKEGSSGVLCSVNECLLCFTCCNPAGG